MCHQRMTHRLARNICISMAVERLLKIENSVKCGLIYVSDKFFESSKADQFFNSFNNFNLVF